MTYRVQLRPAYGGGWIARCNAAPQGVAEARATTESEALKKVRAEIRFRLELCPCSAVSEDYVRIEVERQGPPKGNAWSGG